MHGYVYTKMLLIKMAEFYTGGVKWQLSVVFSGEGKRVLGITRICVVPMNLKRPLVNVF